MSFAVVIEGMTFFSFVVMIAGGKQKRESGWKILAGLLFLIGGVQCAGMTLIVWPLSLSLALHLSPNSSIVKLLHRG